ncbi:hypothetical protein DFP92_10430 [Yoonia sediminilitoris]|uniref:Uncharacterized protein n=1 Tax=Yoonia sediminilitoris TaxID=1286148 RepID=A0A2T6KI52_9RHOB|nr:hypothetical protein C8N45_10430 [Yoonia sediminilitoris]RCW96020.1 hypothetical protein DFP92_10430 [Yoonia sediminilitoris]
MWCALKRFDFDLRRQLKAKRYKSKQIIQIIIWPMQPLARLSKWHRSPMPPHQSCIR